jgi:hypothetical protein
LVGDGSKPIGHFFDIIRRHTHAGDGRLQSVLTDLTSERFAERVHISFVRRENGCLILGHSIGHGSQGPVLDWTG